MGKVAKKPRKSDARKATDPTAARPKKFVFTATPQTDALQRSRILPVVKSLASASAADRAGALSTICNEILGDDTCRFLLLKERIVAKLMGDLVHDSSEDVAVLAWSALHKIAVAEGYDHCVNMFRKDILSNISVVLEKLTVKIESVVLGPSGAGPAKNVWLLTESIIGLLKCLSEESEQALDAISKMDILPFLMGLLSLPANVPENIKSLAIQCLSSLTEDNDTLTSKILEHHAQCVPQLLRLKDEKSPMIRMCACAILHNLSLAPTSEIEISDSQVLPTLTAFIKYTASLDLSSYDPSQSSTEDEAGLRATQIALEVVASVATSVGYELDGVGIEAVDPDPDFIDESVDSDDENMVDDIAELREDMDMTTFDDSSDLHGGADKIIQYLLEITTPFVILLSKPLPPALSKIQLRALAALNNIAWTLDAAAPGRPRLASKWDSHVKSIWAVVIAPVLTGNTADMALADAVTGVAWAVAKASNSAPSLPDGTLHKSFISLYQAATTDDLRSKCVGVLGCLAQPVDRIDINKDIGVFLLGLINAAPVTPTQPAVEALNAIFDIYCDAEYAYDAPVFVQLGFLQYLEEAVTKVRTMVKRVDKNKSPELRERADEALMNLTRFIAYKKKERTAETT